MVQELKDKYIDLFRKFLEENYGVHYSIEKTGTLEVKLNKLMSKNNIQSYKEYYSTITSGNNAILLTQFLDEITTHTTNFFRENHHFEYLRKNINDILKSNKRINANKEIRVWSSACSTGEEPYTIGMVLKEILPLDINIKILATDISEKSIITASKGIYKTEDLEKDISKYYLLKYFSSEDEKCYVSQEVKNLITFRKINLMEPFDFKKGFDIVFCRNVMIYFEPDVQANLVDKIYNILVPRGLFCIGHSESLAFRVHKFKYVEPAIYEKI